jgi:uncharacterized protein (DUF488 family)
MGRSAMQDALFTIGHSTHTQGRFIALLKKHGVTALCDVRSMPYSRRNPQFNKENLERDLLAAGVSYVFLGKELGARSEDPACYEAGKVQYDRLAQTEIFRQGLDRIEEGMKKYRLVLMCAEKEPLECHRTVLVARHLEASSLVIQHIHADGSLENHEDALSRLLRRFHLPAHDMFRSRADTLADAYRLQEERIAYERRDVRELEAYATSGIPGRNSSRLASRRNHAKHSSPCSTKPE